MKRFSRRWFSQIMIPNLIKQELDEMKKVFAIKYNIKYKLSYADVIRILISEYKKLRSVEYPISRKLLVGTKIKRENLKVVVPLKRNPIKLASKLNGKIKVSFLLES